MNKFIVQSLKGVSNDSMYCILVFKDSGGVFAHIVQLNLFHKGIEFGVGGTSHTLVSKGVRHITAEILPYNLVSNFLVTHCRYGFYA